MTHQPGNYSQYQYKINEDSEPGKDILNFYLNLNPIMIILFFQVRLMRPITPVTQRQNVRVRYLQVKHIEKK